MSTLYPITYVLTPTIFFTRRAQKIVGACSAILFVRSRPTSELYYLTSGIFAARSYFIAARILFSI